MLANYGVPVEQLVFPDFFEQYDRVYDLLTGFGELEIDYDLGKKRWHALVDPSLVHH